MNISAIALDDNVHKSIVSKADGVFLGHRDFFGIRHVKAGRSGAVLVGRDGLSFDRPHPDAFDEISLTDDEDDEHWDEHDNRPGHQKGPLHAVQFLELGQGHGQRIHIAGLTDDQRPHEAPPCPHEYKDGQRGDCRFGQWHDDIPVDPKGGTSVDDRRLLQFAGYAHEKLPQHEGAVGGEHGGDDQTVVTVDPPPFSDEDEHRDHGHRGGDHHRGQVSQKQLVAAAEIKPGKGEGRQ